MTSQFHLLAETSDCGLTRNSSFRSQALLEGMLKFRGDGDDHGPSN